MERARRALAKLDSGPAALDTVFREACLDICDAVGVARASIWFFVAAGDAIICERAYDCGTGEFPSGQVLSEADAPSYFAALRRDGAVRADDALAHPATRDLVDGYFTPADVRSLLDHVVFAAGKPVAVLCAEACGKARSWSDQDAVYLSQMAILLGIAIDTRRARYAD